MKQYLDKLKTGGFKFTPRRSAIIEIFEEHKNHMTPEEVWEKLNKIFNKCGLPSVYRNLESLVKCGILTRIHQLDRKKHYGLCSALHNEHHHHITCIKCGKVDEIKECAMNDIKTTHGYKVVNHFFQINGICPKCNNT